MAEMLVTEISQRYARLGHQNFRTYRRTRTPKASFVHTPHGQVLRDVCRSLSL
jgi:hypothetical protein